MFERSWQRIWRRDDPLRRLASGAGVSGAIRMVGLGAAFALQVVLAHWLGASEYGRYAFAWTVAMALALFCGLGLPTAVLRLIPGYLARGEGGRVRGLTRWGWGVTVGLAGVVAAVGTGVLWLGARPGEGVRVDLVLGLWLAPLVALMNLNQEVARSLHRMVLAFGPSLLARPVLVLAGAGVLVMWGGVMGSREALLLTGAALMVVCVAQFVGLRRPLSAAAGGARGVSEAGVWLRTSLPMMLSMGSAMLLTYTDVLMLGVMRTAEDVGVYNAASRLAFLAGVFVNSVNSGAAPALAEFHAKGDVEQMQRVARATAHWSFWPTLVTSGALLVGSPLVLGFMGSEYARGWWPLAILLGARLVQSWYGVAGHALNMTGYHNLAAYLMLGSVVLNVVLNAVAIPMLGINGAAAATAVSVAACYTVFDWVIVRKIGVHGSVLAGRWRAVWGSRG